MRSGLYGEFRRRNPCPCTNALRSMRRWPHCHAEDFDQMTRLGMPYGYSDGLTAARTLKAIFAAKTNGTWSAEAFIESRNWADAELVRASLNTKSAVAGSDASDAVGQSP